MYLLILIATLALIGDMSTGHIPNELFCLGMVASQMWGICNHSLEWGLRTLIGSIIILMILFPLFAIGSLGAGDIKLLMIFPGICGISNTFTIIILAFVIAAVIGSVRLIRYGEFKYRIMKFFDYFKTILLHGQVQVYDQASASDDYRLSVNQIHFTLPIFVSVMLMTQRIVGI